MLQQRAAREAASEQALALARHEYDRRQASLEAARERLEATYGVAAENMVSVTELMQLRFYQASLDNKVRCQENDLNRAGRQVDVKRDEAVKARQERQVMEKLKERHQRVFRQEEESREQKLTEELALYSHLRRSDK